jgi:hypothetical protein
VVVLIVVLLGAKWAFGHEAPTGWAYGVECCHSMDCYQAPVGDVKESSAGYALSTGEIIPYGDHRIKRSQDEYFHECKPLGDPKQMHSICIYVPDRGF